MPSSGSSTGEPCNNYEFHPQNGYIGWCKNCSFQKCDHVSASFTRRRNSSSRSKSKRHASKHGRRRRRSSDKEEEERKSTSSGEDKSASDWLAFGKNLFSKKEEEKKPKEKKKSSKHKSKSSSEKEGEEEGTSARWSFQGISETVKGLMAKPEEGADKKEEDKKEKKETEGDEKKPEMMASAMDWMKAAINSQVQKYNENSKVAYRKQRLSAFLVEYKLEKYEELLFEHEIFSLKQAKRLTAEDLEKMGMTSSTRIARILRKFEECTPAHAIDFWDCLICGEAEQQVKRKKCGRCSKPALSVEGILNHSAAKVIQNAWRTYRARKKFFSMIRRRLRSDYVKKREDRLKREHYARQEKERRYYQKRAQSRSRRHHGDHYDRKYRSKSRSRHHGHHRSSSLTRHHRSRPVHYR